MVQLGVGEGTNKVGWRKVKEISLCLTLAPYEALGGQGLVLPTSGDVRHESEVLHQTAALALGCVSGTEHAPLARVQCAGAAHLEGEETEVRRKGRAIKIGVGFKNYLDMQQNRPSLTFLVFSNWLVMRVIMPMQAMNDRRERTCRGRRPPDMWGGG